MFETIIRDAAEDYYKLEDIENPEFLLTSAAQNIGGVLNEVFDEIEALIDAVFDRPQHNALAYP